MHGQFLQRSRALSLWRSIVRGCRRIGDTRTRAETLQFARDEFERNKEVTDIVSSDTSSAEVLEEDRVDTDLL